MEQEVALTMMGHEEESAPCSSSSLSISWRFIAIASAANDVRSLALLFLKQQNIARQISILYINPSTARQLLTLDDSILWVHIIMQP